MGSPGRMMPGGFLGPRLYSLLIMVLACGCLPPPRALPSDTGDGEGAATEADADTDSDSERYPVTSGCLQMYTGRTTKIAYHEKIQNF